MIKEIIQIELQIFKTNSTTIGDYYSILKDKNVTDFVFKTFNTLKRLNNFTIENLISGIEKTIENKTNKNKMNIDFSNCVYIKNKKDLFLF
jgi:hypothetical protein